MDILEALKTRSSAIKLSEPAPTREQVLQILQAGARAPDHGRLAPWRFVVIAATARERLADAMATGLRARNTNTTALQLQREREKALRAPMIIAVAAQVQKTHKVPEVEQLLAVGAAVENMFLAAHAQGLGAMWKTGEAAYDPVVKATLGLTAEDHIIAFLYLGTLVTKGPVRAVDIDAHVHWLTCE